MPNESKSMRDLRAVDSDLIGLEVAFRVLFSVLMQRAPDLHEEVAKELDATLSLVDPTENPEGFARARKIARGLLFI